MDFPELIVFDIAGTTLQAADQVPECFRNALHTYDVDVSDDEIRAIRGKSKRAATVELLGQKYSGEKAVELMPAVYESFKRTLLAAYKDSPAKPIDGAEATFAWCRDNGIKIALTTGFDRDLATLLIDQAGWIDSLDALVTSDDVAAGRPAPDLIYAAMANTDCNDSARVAVVGDTTSDLKCANNAGAGWTIGVLSGAHGLDQLKDIPHTAILGSVAELPGMFS
jgi:phosphonatase-like hydrolase